MTIRTESRITIAGGVGVVWGYLCDVGRWSEWAPTVVECRMSDGGPLRSGVWVEQRARDLGWNHRRRELVTSLDPPRAMAFAGTMFTSPARWGMLLEPEGGGTTAMMWVEVDLSNVMRVIPGSALRSQVQRVSDIEMAGIKTALESAQRADEGRP
jgi:hypothetical protein